LERWAVASLPNLQRDGNDPLDVVARELHEHARQQITWWPAWEDLDMTDPFESGLIRTAYERARDFVAMSSRSEV
jgi:hypothetical protein